MSAETPYEPYPPYSFRMPKPGVNDPHFGLARTSWYKLILPSEQNKYRPPVRSIEEKQPGKGRGIRLIIYSSARAYFEGLEKEQCG